MIRFSALALLLVQQVTGQDLDRFLEKADAILEESKAAYEKARVTDSVPGFLDAAFKLEEARIKYLVLQEIGQGDKQSVAEKELSFPEQAADRAALADGWADLAEKERSALKKGQLQSHARFLYESALQGSSGLTRAKIEKRLGELGRSPVPVLAAGGVIDLLEKIDAARDAVSGKWSFDGKALVTPVDEFSRLQVPVPVPEEYDLEIVAQRTGAKPENLMFGLVGGGAQFMVLLDGFAGTKCGIGMIDGKNYDVNETTRRGAPVLSSDKPNTIRCSVRKDRVTVSVDGKPLLDWKADYSRVSIRNVWAVRDKKAIFIGCYNTAYRITKMTLQPAGAR